jgi:hypothetical protein
VFVHLFLLYARLVQPVVIQRPHVLSAALLPFLSLAAIQVEEAWERFELQAVLFAEVAKGALRAC